MITLKGKERFYKLKKVLLLAEKNIIGFVSSTIIKIKCVIYLVRNKWVYAKQL